MLICVWRCDEGAGGLVSIKPSGLLSSEFSRKKLAGLARHSLVHGWMYGYVGVMPTKGQFAYFHVIVYEVSHLGTTTLQSQQRQMLIALMLHVYHQMLQCDVKTPTP